MAIAATRPPVHPLRRDVSAWLLIPVLAGALVAIALGTYGQVHDPAGKLIFRLFFTTTLNMKVWFGTFAVMLAVVQVLTSLRFFDVIRWPAPQPRWTVPVHRWSGILAFAVTLPVAYHCLWSLGFGDETPRRLAHSLAGCAFYGALVTKLFILRSERPWPPFSSNPSPGFWPGWVLGLAGGAVFTALVVVWYSSSLWFFRTIGFPQF
ncbi:MAG: DUF6529 family protein [Dehalococcoidia bacterium]